MCGSRVLYNHLCLITMIELFQNERAVKWNASLQRLECIKRLLCSWSDGVE